MQAISGIDDQQEQAQLARAAEYVRMSTEHQQYSTESQADRIREYASRRSIEIVRTYTDAGKSGLRIQAGESGSHYLGGRPSQRRLPLDTVAAFYARDSV